MSCGCQNYPSFTSGTHSDVSYICSRIFLTDPPGDDNALELHPAAPDALREKERELAETEPEVNPWVCLGTIVITIALMAVTAEFLVDTLERVRESGNLREECVLQPRMWFR